MTGKRPVVLVVCDGWGENPDDFGNAIRAARTPCLDAMYATWPHTLVAASGEAVGLPDGQQGNSEVGHLTIGAGRVIRQPLTRIHHEIASGEFFRNAVMVAAIDRAIARGTRLHVIGMISPGGVHSHQDHAVAVVRMAQQRGLERVVVHAFTDGRDEPPTSAVGFVETFEAALRDLGTGSIATIAGRYYAMDRDNRWDRVARAYATLVGDGDDVAESATGYIRSRYDAGITDEFLEPAAIVPPGGKRAVLNDGDVVVFFNFRPDRARELSHALVDADFTGFDRGRVITDLDLVTFSEYDRTLGAPVVFPKPDVRNSLAEVVGAHGLRQFHVAETEKYAHVTYFINGGREDAFDGEERQLIPSPRVATYDATPAMSAVGVTDSVLEHLASGDDALIIVNFANADMVGHTGDLAATTAAVEVVDTCLGRIAGAARTAGGAVLITADHGNAELKIDRRDNSVLTAHTTSPVPVIVCGAGHGAMRGGGGLADVAPTVLEAMGLPVPADMTGASLFSSESQAW